MNKFSVSTVIILLSVFVSLSAQKAGYYNGVEGKSGAELKSALHNIIKGHVDFSYSDCKYIMNYADADPNNESNIICIYTRRSQPNTSWGTGSNDLNREHVWAKSHGNFADIRPMDGDAFNLHPCDASTNITRSNMDFDYCSSISGAGYIAEALAYYTSTGFEPQDAAKGEVARTIFYMATRYEGENGELNLEINDQVGNYPNPYFGKLSTLLKWNNDFPPTAFERRRNERVFEAQRNRNPFIDHPEYADLIWNNQTAPVISIGSVSMLPEYPSKTDVAGISANITTTAGNITSAVIYYGSVYNSEEFSSDMIASGDIWTGNIDFTKFQATTLVYFKIVASNGTSVSTMSGSYRLPDTKTITPLSQVNQDANLMNTNISVAGVVTANLDNSFYIQTNSSPYSGLCIYDIKRGQLGDSVVVSGKVTSYEGLTEIGNVSYLFNYGQKRKIQPLELALNQVNSSYVGMLVKFKNVIFLDGDKIIPLTSTNLSFTDGTNSMIAFARYNSRISGKKLPAGSVDVTGVISTYKGTLQLLINDISDITAASGDELAPIIAGITIYDKNWIEITFSKNVNTTNAVDPANYSFTEGLEITSAYMYGTSKVLLGVTGMKAVDYVLTINGVSDLGGHEMINVQKQFHSDINDPAYLPISCIDDYATDTDNPILFVDVVSNDDIPADYSLTVLKQPNEGIASISLGKVKYESAFAGNHHVLDTVIYQVCMTENPSNCAEGKLYITLDFTNNVNSRFAGNIKLWPNPVVSELNFSSDHTFSYIEISDISGKTVLSLKPGKPEFSINMPEGKGIYFVKMRLDSGEVFIEKIVK